ncbi:hypothetical protein VFPPC_03287 [Pochonia chlamydosporia 170]|uniref:Uncharacterized protein n=1 Tax=Pochonia chlamydosporia 170 TaxID=1380566 RepID=A0A179FZT1_METCM|nr:hypothetical protein VFPPC_03287 [Pochonia chlamydosporia 170]OAQ70897.1 hypothetical protein VFPPC_03287 [Pochonia chlamydosporia 170]
MRLPGDVDPTVRRMTNGHSRTKPSRHDHQHPVTFTRSGLGNNLHLPQYASHFPIGPNAEFQATLVKRGKCAWHHDVAYDSINNTVGVIDHRGISSTTELTNGDAYLQAERAWGLTSSITGPSSRLLTRRDFVSHGKLGQHNAVDKSRIYDDDGNCSKIAGNAIVTVFSRDFFFEAGWRFPISGKLATDNGFMSLWIGPGPDCRGWRR